VSTSHLNWESFLGRDSEPATKYAELVDGALVVEEPPAWLDQHVVGGLLVGFGCWVTAGPGRGDVTRRSPVRITDQRGYLPDVAWYREGRHRPAAGEPYLSGAPDIAIEVLSPSTRTHDQIRKRTDYARIGVREYWLIDPEEPVAYLLRRAGEELPEFVQAAEVTADGVLSSPLLPGLEIPFATLLP